MSRLVKQNADFLASHTIDDMNALISEKRALRKLYVDEHNRIHGELLRVSLDNIVIRTIFLLHVSFLISVFILLISIFINIY